MSLFGDAVGNLFVLFGKDKELYRLTRTVHDIIQDDADDEQRYKTENHPSPIVEYEVAGTDDDNVASHNHASQSDVAVFMDDGCDNVRTARTSVAVEHYAQTRTAHGGTYEASHEILSRSQYLRRHSVRSVHQQLEKP